MENVVMVAPNAGLEMGGGGGCRVAAKMAEAMNEKGYKVELVALTGYPLEQIESAHNVRLTSTDLHYLLEKAPVSELPEPMALSILSIYVRRLLSKSGSRLVVFHDDVLQASIKNYRGRTLLYTHFPHLHKELNYRSLAKEGTISLKQRIYDSVNRKLLPYDHNLANVIIANSTFTAHYCKTLWNRNDIRVMFPPVDNPFAKSEDLLSKKERLVMCIGVMHPQKRFEVAIQAYEISRTDFDLVILGYQPKHGGNDYMKRLVAMSKKIEPENHIRIVCNVSEEMKWNMLSKTKVIVHGASLEPFGIAVVEGMISGAVPIVHEGPFSGPWVDIIDRGRYGLGFKDPRDLSTKIDGMLEDEDTWTRFSGIAKERAKIFEASKFKHDFMEVVDGLYSCA